MSVKDVTVISQESFDFIEKQLERYFKLLEGEAGILTDQFCHKRIAALERLLLDTPNVPSVLEVPNEF